MLGVPVVHGAHVGPFQGYFSPDLPDVAYDSAYLGEAMIVDGWGRVLARRDHGEGAGAVLAEIDLPGRAAPIEPIPPAFWLPPEMPTPWKESWERWLKNGARYYQAVTLPYLRTGEIPEYPPDFL